VRSRCLFLATVCKQSICTGFAFSALWTRKPAIMRLDGPCVEESRTVNVSEISDRDG
jgi:hypothetical protein